MLKGMREQIGTAGLVVAIIALIAALGGGAYAATQAVHKKGKPKYVTKPEATKIAKQYAGKEGPPGSAGSNGTNGTNGKDGLNGKDGTPGAPGEDGKSVESSPIAVGAEGCNKQGGAIYEVEESGVETVICNGKEGSPWTAGGTLPPGATETGYWSFSAPPGKITVDVGGTPTEIELVPQIGKILAPISFPIPMPFALKGSHTHYLTAEQAGQLKRGEIHGEPGELCEGKTGTELAECEATQQALHTSCSGNFISPKAAPGELCVYEIINEATFLSIFEAGASGAGTAGAIIKFAPSTEASFGEGTFAVTSCEEKSGQKECKP